MEQQNLGMQTRNVITVHVPLNWERYPKGTVDFYLRAEAALRRLPGVTAVGMSNSLPPDGWHGGTRYSDLEVVGKAPTPAGAWRRRGVAAGYARLLSRSADSHCRRARLQRRRTRDGSASRDPEPGPGGAPVSGRRRDRAAH
jgi:hypothetical protein